MPRKASSPVTSDPKSTPTVTLGTKFRYSRAEACFLLGMSEAQLCKRIQQGALRTVTDGRRRYLTDTELRRYGEQSR